MRVLKLYDGKHQEAFEYLGEYAHLYGDNGGNPDGNCWLPNAREYRLDPIPDDLVQTVTSQMCGDMVEVMLTKDEGMVNYLNGFSTSLLGVRSHLMDDTFDEEDVARIQQILADLSLQWAHYGAYGASDSTWVFIPPQVEEA